MADTTTSAPASRVRDWARDHGFEVGARGRFSSELIEAFNKGRKVKYVVGAGV